MIMMNIRRPLCLLLTIMMLIMCGCNQIPMVSNGSVKADDVKKIVITNGLTNGNSFTVEERDSITTIIRYFNSYQLENGTASANGYHYKITAYASDDSKLLVFNIIDEDAVSVGDQTYAVNAKKLLNTVETLECATLTDEELLRTMFEGSYFDDVTILNEDGEISLDKILSIKNDCPALFELIGRPSAITSLGTYGIDLLDEYLSSDDSAVRQKAEEIAEVLKNFFPNLKDKINKILENN
jgi:hypothetical protein